VARPGMLLHWRGPQAIQLLVLWGSGHHPWLLVACTVPVCPFLRFRLHIRSAWEAALEGADPLRDNSKGEGVRRCWQRASLEDASIQTRPPALSPSSDSRRLPSCCRHHIFRTALPTLSFLVLLILHLHVHLHDLCDRLLGLGCLCRRSCANLLIAPQPQAQLSTASFFSY